MGWKPITLPLISQFQQCIAQPQSDGHQLSQKDLDIVSACFDSVFTESAPPTGGPVLEATPALVAITHPEEPGIIKVKNTGDPAQIAWTAEKEAPADWYEIEPPTSGTVTTGEATVSLNPFWSGSFPADQNTTKTGRIVIKGTHQGNPVQGSPKVVEFRATRTASTVPPDPPPSGNFGPCGDNQSQDGDGAWNDWCVDEKANFPTGAGGIMGMESNAEAVRSRLPGAPPRGIAPPTVGSNRVIVECDLRFNQGWLDPLSLGGQHLFKVGEGPFRLSGGSGATSPDHIRFDFGCFNLGGGNGFRDGFRVLVYHKKQGQTHAETWFPDATKIPNAFVAGQWTAVFADCRYEPSTGRCDLTLRIGSTQRVVNVNVSSGINPKLGDSVSWGNVDQRPGIVEIRNLRYRTS